MTLENKVSGVLAIIAKDVLGLNAHIGKVTKGFEKCVARRFH
jgi:hypothetical protein